MSLLSRLRGGGSPASRLDDGHLANAWQIISLLLRYPDDELVSRAEILAEVAGTLPGSVADPLTRFLSELTTSELRSLQSEFVDTFDVTRRCCLYLTYFSCGDTRKRGVALVRFKQRYRAAGVEFDSEELPDHLSVVLEFGAQHDVDTTWKLLLEHRAGIEMLRIALTDKQSRWLPVVEALTATLPELKGDDAQRLQTLIAAGPPSEDVGLDLTPYGMDPELYSDPRTTTNSPGAPAFLGADIPVGERLSMGGQG